MTDPYADAGLDQALKDAQAITAPADAMMGAAKLDWTPPPVLTKQQLDSLTGVVPVTPPDPADISDGYHTMQELYGHRRALTAVLATIAAINGDSWRSKAHHPDDDPMFDGYFIVGIELPAGPISYHYPLAVWDNFAAVPVLEHAPKWDGHTGDEVIYRLMDFSGVLRAAMDEVTAAAQVVETAEKGTDG